MRVTAVIPCHNHRAWVNDAVDSVANQDYATKRVIVVDDGSSDGSAQVVLDRLDSLRVLVDEGERWVKAGKTASGVDVAVARLPQSGGPSHARNVGIKLAWEDTDVFAFLDSDDRYEPGKIARSVEKLRLSPAMIGEVYSDYDTLSTSGLRLRHYKPPFSREGLLRECIVNMDSLVSKCALEAVGLFDESLRVAEDYDLHLRISERFLIIHVPESLVLIRTGDHSSTATVRQEVWQSNWRRVMEKTRQRGKL